MFGGQGRLFEAEEAPRNDQLLLGTSSWTGDGWVLFRSRNSPEHADFRVMPNPLEIHQREGRGADSHSA